MSFKTVFSKITLAIIIPLVAVSLLMSSFATAADPTVVPLGKDQNDMQMRQAYRALFEYLQAGKRAYWTQEPFNQSGQSYPSGTIIAPDGLQGNFNSWV